MKDQRRIKSKKVGVKTPDICLVIFSVSLFKKQNTYEPANNSICRCTTYVKTLKEKISPDTHYRYRPADVVCFLLQIYVGGPLVAHEFTRAGQSV